MTMIRFSLLVLMAPAALLLSCLEDAPVAESTELSGWDQVRMSWGEGDKYDADSPEAEEAWSAVQAAAATPEANTSSGSGTNPACYVTKVTSYSPGKDSAGNTLSATNTNSSLVIGAPQNNNTNNFASLGIGGEIIVEFPNPVLNVAGDDLTLTETSFGNNSCSSYPEEAEVWGSQDNVTYTKLGSGCLDFGVDLGSLNWVRYVKVIDITDTSKFTGTINGYDLDGITATSCGQYCPSWVSNPQITSSIEYKNHRGLNSQGYVIYYLGDTMTAELEICNGSSVALQNVDITTLEEFHNTGKVLKCSSPVQRWTNVTIPAKVGTVNGCSTFTYTFKLDNNCPIGNYQTHVLMTHKGNWACNKRTQVFNNAQVGIYDPPVSE